MMKLIWEITFKVESDSIRDKTNPLIEVAEPTALADALARAGFKPSEDPDAQQAAQRNKEWAAEKLKKEQALDSERAYRKRLFTAVSETTGQRYAEPR